MSTATATVVPLFDEGFTIARRGWHHAAEYAMAARAEGGISETEIERRLTNAYRILETKFKFVLAQSEHGPALLWYHHVAMASVTHASLLARHGVHPYSADHLNTSWELFKSWKRMEEEIVALGYRTVSLRDLVAAVPRFQDKVVPEPIFHLVGVKRDEGENGKLHAFDWENLDPSAQVERLVPPSA